LERKGMRRKEKVADGNGLEERNDEEEMRESQRKDEASGKREKSKATERRAHQSEKWT